MNTENITVLLVESDDILRTVYRRIIAGQTKHVLVATDGEEGFKMFQSSKPDLIITDIKLPVINGIDMIRKIRRNDKTTRVIMMSAFIDTKYFIQAIETGVKGFLTKPVDSTRLAKVLKEQIHEIVLEQKIKEEEIRRREAEQAREKSDNILRVLSETTALFLKQGISDENVNSTLRLLGEATHASRLYIFKKHIYKEMEVVSQVYEWVNNGIQSQLHNNDLQNIPVNSGIFLRWIGLLQENSIILGDVKTDFPDIEKQVLEMQDIKSLLVIPVFAENEWWGFIGLDECEKVRQWSDVEINALRLVASNIGAAFYRKRVEYQLISLNADLESRVKERTKELELEITERKRAEILLRESEEKYRLIFENANDGILLTDKQGKILMLNPQMIEIFGLIPRDVIGKSFCGFIDKPFRDPAKSILRIDSTNPEPVTADVIITHKNKQKHWLELKPTAINWDNNKAFLIFASEITLRKKAQDELNKLNLHLENRVKTEVRKVEQQQQLLIQKSKLESMGELSAGLAHEINQPLGGLSMGLDNILYKLNENELTNEYLVSKLTVLFKDIERIRSIINHVRVFSRDQQNIQKEKIEVKKIIQNSVSLIANQFSSENITLTIEYADKPVFIHVNQFRIEQVLLNLLSNAKYAVNKKSALSNDTRYKKNVTIKVASKAKMMLIMVEDNGVGMNEEVLCKIFDPFFSTKDSESGTGIGLSISYGIIKESNGNIIAQSIPGKGTTMIVELPTI
ncbi:MAG: hypothetical protein DRJ09_12810 [Bacteroidetes bacterium]|nr:MAG: hypothetical protein DRJ09_12810 [Bacteroidota bacterium]